MDSLRYWVTDMHVDGFRFDLAPVLLRGLEDGRHSAFFEVIQQDPVLSQVKLIAEPWDVGPDGYQLGRFPPGWAEWNGAFRDCVRRFWRGDRGHGPRTGLSPHRLERHLRSERPAQLRQRQLRDVPRRLHADATWSASRDDTTRPTARTTRTGRPRTTAANWGVEGLTESAPHQAAPRPDQAQHAGHPLLLPGRADAPRRRRDRPQSARQQQCLLPGQRDHLAELGPRRPGTRALAYTRRLVRSSTPTRSCATGTSSPASRSLPAARRT